MASVRSTAIKALNGALKGLLPKPSSRIRSLRSLSSWTKALAALISEPIAQARDSEMESVHHLWPQPFSAGWVEISSQQLVNDRLLFTGKIFRVIDRGICVDQLIIWHGRGGGRIAKVVLHSTQLSEFSQNASRKWAHDGHDYQDDLFCFCGGKVAASSTAMPLRILHSKALIEMPL